ncbi:helix-turn-helix domain-containing protein [Streptomyces sp. ATE26]|nr:helix-turn-helix domain-containing protein [Streptomyces sp. ATE26]MDI1456467.1 helix-turn-helix domain-containing protein [Streptomyces sp. ATE26]
MTEPNGGWSFLTSHARVLLAIAREGDLRLRDIATACHNTKRTAQSIVTDLEQAGWPRRAVTSFPECGDGSQPLVDDRVRTRPRGARGSRPRGV